MVVAGVSFRKPYLCFMQRIKSLGLAVLSGATMGVSWPATGSLAALFFVALVPLLLLEYEITLSKRSSSSQHVFYYTYLTFLIFNLWSLWWIWNASPGGMVMAVMINAFFMSLIFLGFHKVRKQLGDKRGYFTLVTLWLGFEWVHFNWELDYPWLTFGNVFANHTTMIQWYEYTGVMGGSLWVLIVNVGCFLWYKNTLLSGVSVKKKVLSAFVILGLVVVPLTVSWWLYFSYQEKKDPVEVVVVQPNIDPYFDKFSGMTEVEQIDRIIELAREKVTPNTQYIVAPETALPRGYWESELERNYGVQAIKNVVEDYPNIGFITGISSYIAYPEGEYKPTPTARLSKTTGSWYDAFNSTIQIDASDVIPVYHKSKQVIGVEKIPYPKVFSLLERFTLDLGGTTGSLGKQEEAEVFRNGAYAVAPLICYESVFGDYVGDFVQKGANFIFISTNDGWWGDTPGYHQHMAYARLRAIENRRSVARSANTGTSCFINQKGDVFEATKWWEPAVIRNTLNANSTLTYYTKHGDYIGRIAVFLAVLMIAWSWSVRLRKSSS